MRTDDELKEILSNKKVNKHCRTVFYKLTSEEQKYICSKFNDSKSINETIYRFINDLFIRPTCKYCGGEIKSFRFDRGFAKFCSKSCATGYNNIKRNSILTMQNSLLKKYNVNNPSKIKEINIKRKNTCMKKYGVEFTLQDKNIRENIKNTCMKKYGVSSSLNLINCIKAREASIYKKYGTKFPTQSKIFWENYDFKKAKEKEYSTKRKNNSFHTSKPENICYNLLCNKFKNVIRQYRSNKYPFNCDFYIPELELYIEYNGSHYHHYHAFNENNENDKIEFERLNTLAKNSKRHLEGKKSQYDVILYIWTDLDPRKRNIAKENKLNFIEFWNIDEVKEWINNLIY